MAGCVEYAEDTRNPCAPPWAFSWISSSFTSAMAITGKSFRKIRKAKENRAKLPASTVSSAQLGV